MQVRTGYEQQRARIEIVPLIDVVFLLLVFFIYAMLSMTVYRGLRVDLPRGRGQPEAQARVVITISADNAISMDGAVLDMAEAVAAARLQSAGTAAPVIVSGDRRADLGVGMELLAALREEGIGAVSFQVRAER